MHYARNYESPIGNIFLAADEEGLTELRFAPQPAAENERKKFPVLERAVEWLDTYFSGKEPRFTPMLHMIGTDFQITVWKLLLKIPYGKTASYGEIAREVAALRGIARMAAQAVGGAVGRNPIPIIVPCHRVIGSDGRLTGYSCGIDIKVKLLALEKNGAL